MDIENVFQLNSCLNWIQENNFKRVVLQLKKEDLKHSVQIYNYIKDKCQNENIDLYITQSFTCCVDLLVTQHLSKLDSLIHFGDVCLSKPEINNKESKLPVLFNFGKQSIASVKFYENIQTIVDKVESLIQSNCNYKICLFYDTSMIEYANVLGEKLDKIDVARLYCPADNWTTTPENLHKLVRNNSSGHKFGQYVLPRHVSEYQFGIYLGKELSLHLSLEGPSKLYQYDFLNQSGCCEEVVQSKLLNKRIALIGRIKEEVELKIGVIITNPLPNIADVMERIETYSKPRKHTLYFISMIQTIDECKIGNFDLCDAFIVINSCTCSKILKSLFFNRPILTELEYKLACGFEAEYGRILWPGSSTCPSEDDMINKRRVSDVSLALFQTRNELLERCSQARANKWSGLDYSNKATDGSGVEENPSREESLVVEEGLKGIASSYLSEPLKKHESKLEGDGR